jgi:hypothetical protein
LSAEIAARLQELRAAVEEYEHLVAAMNALGEQRSTTAAKAAPRAKAKAPAKAKVPAPAKPPAKAKAPAQAKAPATIKSLAKAKAPAQAKAPVKGKARAKAKALVKDKAPAAIERDEEPKARVASSRTQDNGDQQAILAALEHGSHTVGELAVVTAMAGPSIREALRRLSKAGRVTRATREGKAAYVLAG